MSVNIPTPQRNNNKLAGEFYPLQKQELIALRKNKLINNTAFVHLALRYENPFCDRPVEVIPKEFSLKWNIPESSVYEAIAKLKKLGILLIKKGRLIIDWVQNKINNPQQDFQEEELEDFWDSRTNSEIPESILRSQKNLRDSRMNSENSENRSPDRLIELNPDFPQTSQTIQTSTYVSESDKHTKENILQINEENGQGAINESAIDQKEIKEAIAKSLNTKQDKIFRDCNTIEIERVQYSGNIYSLKKKKKHEIDWQWMPEGAWCVNGKIDPAFLRWYAQRWLDKYDDIADIYEAEADVLAYFCNNPKKISIRWRQYQKQFLHKADNMKTRIDHECKIKDKEKQDFCDRINALKPLDDSQSVEVNNDTIENNPLMKKYHQLNQDNKQEVDLKALMSNNQEEDVIETEAVNIYKNEQENNPVNIYKVEEDKPVKKEKPTYYTCPETGETFLNVNNHKYKDIRAINEEREKIPVNPKAMEMLGNFLQGLKGKGGK